jgi:hypothetical protein
MRVNEFDPLGISSASSWRVRRRRTGVGEEGREREGRKG